MNKQLLAQLRALLPDSSLIMDKDVLESHAADWSKSSPQPPLCVLRPTSTAEVSAILSLCNDHKQAIVTQGGLTGLSGGATPKQGEVALSLARMQGVIELDEKGQTISVHAGTSLQSIQEHAATAGFKLALDLGARGNCSIGGNLATNAGGNQVIKYGMARAQVLGLRAVRADGTVLDSMNNLLKNNAGYDLKHLFIGSEGTLGVITECVLRLHPKPKAVYTALCACESFDNIVRLLNNLQAKLGTLSAFEVMWNSYFRFAIDNVEHARDPMQGEHNFYALVEFESINTDHAQEFFLETLLAEMNTGVVSDVVVAQSEQDALEFWAIRDAIADILGQLAPLANFDIGVPIKHMERFVTQIHDELHSRYPGLTFFVFGHLGDGNLHLCASTGNADDAKEIYALTYQIGAKYGASVTAEHGVGWQKKGYLTLCRTEAELDLMRELKRLLDPNNILNPGRVIDC